MRSAYAALMVGAVWLAAPASACSAYSCDGVGWQAYDASKPGVMAAYQQARLEGTVEALDRFIAAYPGSPAASEALDLKARLEERPAIALGDRRR